MSLFVALWPSPPVRGQLESAVRAARPTARGLRWSPPRERHLTLVFLGEVGGRLPELTRALDRALAGRPALDLSLEDWGTFPLRADRAAVLWAGVGGEGLHELAEVLGEAARATGVPVASRPFVPHITLARARPPRDAAETLRALGPAPSADWSVDRVDLVESRPGDPDRYRTVRTWGLLWGSDSQRAPERGTS
ncbi:RNA 2',3'-cyclic phosphodiesterase [Nocardiopsis terrae]|uniref:RNA 2',3'-cyclic phosphodiesterase n=1 Tax=Nocardiopsis terrae TaxID=372655 RepID=A0ABR9HBE1_9ACTN|nr:RNA 2',3'-cyclic phosphodiesterase [Nocardiopsis terrae]MBE1456236.1 2'-5' RNA ligase [Nocardiopsis terrae]GHC78004.1 RNA 2',3'-cyclic phosphodiesterase [Nocardiopsis terrae]